MWILINKIYPIILCPPLHFFTTRMKAVWESGVLDQRYRSEWVEFEYPGFWALDEHEDPGQQTVSLQSTENRILVTHTAV